MVEKVSSEKSVVYGTFRIYVEHSIVYTTRFLRKTEAQNQGIYRMQI